MTKREALVNRICVVLLLVGAAVLAAFAARGEPQRPPVDATAAINDAHFAFVTIRDLSYDRPDTEAMLESAWQTALRAAALPGKPSRSGNEDHEEALAEDIEFLISRSPSRSFDAVVDSYIEGLAKGAGNGAAHYEPFYMQAPPALEAFTGIVSVRDQTSRYRIIQVAADSAASRAGLRPNDLFAPVPSKHGGTFQSSNFDVLIDVWRGEEGAKLRQRRRVRLEVDFTLPIVVTVTELDPGLTLIKVDHFSTNPMNFYGQLLRYQMAGRTNKVILDLRNSVGGQSINAASLLLEMGYEGPFITNELANGQSGSVPVDILQILGQFAIPPWGPAKIVVLVNGSTASLAEAVAWILREERGATIVGSDTPGRLRGNSVHPLRENGVLWIPAARTLLGEEQVDLEGIGITPDIIVEQDNAGLAAGRDNVLERAIQLLNAP